MEWSINDGDKVHKGLKFGKVQGKLYVRNDELLMILWLNNNLALTFVGKAHSIVIAERVVLNFMQRMSGIATLTKVCLSSCK